MDPTSHHIYGRIGSHSIIRPACREGRGDAGAFNEAVNQALGAYARALVAWRLGGKEPVFHLVLGIEFPEESPDEPRNVAEAAALAEGADNGA